MNNQEKEINLNDLKSESSGLKKVEISDIAPKAEYDGVTKQAAQEDIMAQVDIARSRYEKNFENEMKEKFQKEAAENVNKEQVDEFSEFMDGDEQSSINNEYRSKIDLEPDVNNLDGANVEVTMEKKIIIPGVTNEDTIKFDVISGDAQMNITSYDQIPKSNPPLDIHEKDAVKTVQSKINNTPKIQPGNLGEHDNFMNTDEFVGSVSDSEKIDDSDFEDILAEDRDFKAEQKALVDDIRKKINPIKKPVDLASLTISKNPTFINNALQYQSTDRHVSDWVLFEGKQLISMESFSGTELENIDTRNYPNRTRYNTFLEVYKLIFSHLANVVDKSKYIEWLKTFLFFDLNHIWFSVYKSTFEKANIIPYVCRDPKCGHRFVKEIKDILEMVKFRTDEDKAAFDELFNSLPSTYNPEYKVREYQITDDIIIDLRDPSIWNVIFENAILPEKFREKYAKLLNTVSFIDTIYVINRDEDGNAISKSIVKYKEHPENMVKDIMSRIYTYAKMLENLTKDQKIIVDSYILDIHNEHENVTYRIPACTCEKCGKEIPEVEATGEELVFTRQELVEMTLS